MVKLALVPILLAIACLFAGTYGAVHNQISYTVAPEYFTQFKFYQFGMEDVPNRLGAAMIGWKAAWWMGIVIGMILIPLGFKLRGTSNYFWCMIRAFGIVAKTALVVGLASLSMAFLNLDGDAVGEVTRYGNDIIDDLAFARAGTMHNFSYLGGLLGVVTGGITISRQIKRQNRNFRGERGFVKKRL